MSAANVRSPRVHRFTVQAPAEALSFTVENRAREKARKLGLDYRRLNVEKSEPIGDGKASYTVAAILR